MKNSLISFLNQFTSIGLLGYGVEGKSTYRYIRKHFPALNILIFDDQKAPANESDSVNFFSLSEWSEHVAEVGLWIKSPGIPWSNQMVEHQDQFTSQSALFMEHSLGKKIGVTGSLGKSTTCQYLHDALKASGRPVYLGGNIGKPLLDFIDDVCLGDVTIAELSSYQLKNISCSPDIAVMLNMYPDHLDYHVTRDDYYLSKSAIGQFQSKDQVLIHHTDIPSQYIKGAGKRISFSTNDPSSDFFAHDHVVSHHGNLDIKIDQNTFWKESDQLNLCAVIAVLDELGVSELSIGRSLSGLSQLNYRLESLGLVKGIEFFNDSISTIPESAINAMRSVEGVDVIILGGFNRGINQQKLIDELMIQTNIKAIFCMGDTGLLIHDELKSKKRTGVNLIKNYHEFFKTLTRDGGFNKCVFSPGAPSFGMYKNFIERGQAFHEALMNWKNEI